MYFDLTPEQLEAWMGAQTGEQGTADTIYAEWREKMSSYSAGLNGSPQISFWLVIALPKKDFSENVDPHPTLPMLIPKEGKGQLVGIASTKAELDKLTVPEGPGTSSKDDWKKDKRRDQIFITYKIKLQGSQNWRDLIEFCGHNNMLIDSN